MKNRKRNRLEGYDYSSDNLYFVTIFVQNMVCCFGEIVGTGRDLSVPDLSVPNLSVPALSPQNHDESNPNQSNKKMVLNTS